MGEVKEIPIIKFRLLTLDGYFEAYFSYTKTEKTFKDAYLKTEEELNKYFNLSRYKTYSTFRTSKAKYQKLKKLKMKKGL